MSHCQVRRCDLNCRYFLFNFGDVFSLSTIIHIVDSTEGDLTHLLRNRQIFCKLYEKQTNLEITNLQALNSFLV